MSSDYTHNGAPGPSVSEVMEQAAHYDGIVAGFTKSVGAILMAAEVEADGDMSITGRVLDQAIDDLLIEVREVGGHAAAATYARIMIKTLSKYTMETT
jgi:hypothetical protein